MQRLLRAAGALLRERIRRVPMRRRVLIGLGAAASVVACFVVIDAMFAILSVGFRWMLVLALLSAVGYAGYRYLYRPLLRRLASRREMKAESIPQRRARGREVPRQPEVVVAAPTTEKDLMGGGGDDLTQRAVMREAVGGERGVGCARRKWLWGIGLLAMAGVGFVVWQEKSPASAPAFTYVTGNLTVELGAFVAIEAVTADSIAEALEIRIDRDGDSKVELMSLVPNAENRGQRYRAEFPMVVRPFRYQIAYEKGHSAWYTVALR